MYDISKVVMMQKNHPVYMIVYKAFPFQFAYKDGFEHIKATLENEELDAPVSTADS